MNISQQVKKGNKVAYYIQRKSCMTDSEVFQVKNGIQQVRRVGIAKGWCDGKVVVLHKAGYTELVAEGDLIVVN